jgi:hypothetical protein
MRVLSREEGNVCVSKKELRGCLVAKREMWGAEGGYAGIGSGGRRILGERLERIGMAGWIGPICWLELGGLDNSATNLEVTS